MVDGGKSLLAGQSFAAIESFNKVLNLPSNKYTQDAQLWIAIAKERSGQQEKAILEFNAFLKLYPNGRSATWVQARLDRLKQSQPAITVLAKSTFVPVKVKNTEFQYSEFGSLSTYYYQGSSQTDSVQTVGAKQTSNSLSRTDQQSLMANLNMTARAFNNEYDNRLVFQDYYSANFLPGQKSSQRLGAAFYEMRDRIVNYSVKIGRQSGFGGGVMGRFDGISAGYGFAQEWKVNVVTGQLSDDWNKSKPNFNGVSLDFGTRSRMGGSVYFINQTVSGFTDRRAVGGNLRYFDQRFNVMSTLDYDVLFKALNMITVQGALMGSETGTDFNFMLDRRRSPMLDIRNAVNGTSTTFDAMVAAGSSAGDLIMYAKQRTAISNMAQVGMTNHLNEKWNIGTDFTITNTSGLPRSGGNTNLSCDASNAGFIPMEGCVDPTPASGNTWTISERMTGMGVIQPRDITNFNLNYTKSQQSTSVAFQVSNHVDLREKWTLDTTFRLSTQSSTPDSKSNDLSPTVRASYKLRNNMTLDGQFGLDWNRYSSTITDSSNTTSSYTAKAFRKYYSFGGRYDF